MRLLTGALTLQCKETFCIAAVLVSVLILLARLLSLVQSEHLQYNICPFLWQSYHEHSLAPYCKSC